MDEEFHKQFGPVVLYAKVIIDEPPPPYAGVDDPWLEAIIGYRWILGGGGSIQQDFHTRLTIAFRWVLLLHLYKWIARVIKTTVVFAMVIAYLWYRYIQNNALWK